MLTSPDTNPELRTTLVEEYSNKEKLSDSEIYHKVRQYEREGNVCFKKRWKAHLSNHGRRGLRQLCGHGDGEFVAAFNKLLDIPGLWDGIRISTVYKMLEMKCDEVDLPSVGFLLAHTTYRRLYTILTISGRPWKGFLSGFSMETRPPFRE